MNSQIAKIAAESREEISFWPIAATAYLFIQSTNLWYLIVFLIAVVPASYSYLLIKKYRGIENPSLNPNISDKEDSMSIISVDTVLFGSNFLVSGVLYMYLVQEVTSSLDPGYIGVGLIMLPMITISMYISSKIWRKRSQDL